MGSDGGSGGSEETTGQGASQDAHVPHGVQKWLQVMAGQTWPEGSESGLRTISQACRTYAQALKTIGAQVPGVGRQVQEGMQGQAGDAFGRTATDVQSLVEQAQDQLEQMAKSAENAAADIQKAKIMIIVMMIMMLVAIAELLASIFGALAIPAEIATTRALIQGIMQALRQALAKAVSMAAVKAAATTAAKYAAFGAGFMGGLDLAVQVGQDAAAKRSGIDWNSFGHSVLSGAIGGAGFGVGHALADGADGGGLGCFGGGHALAPLSGTAEAAARSAASPAS